MKQRLDHPQAQQPRKQILFWDYVFLVTWIILMIGMVLSFFGAFRALHVQVLFDVAEILLAVLVTIIPTMRHEYKFSCWGIVVAVIWLSILYVDTH